MNGATSKMPGRQEHWAWPTRTVGTDVGLCGGPTATCVDLSSASTSPRCNTYFTFAIGEAQASAREHETRVASGLEVHGGILPQVPNWRSWPGKGL